MSIFKTFTFSLDIGKNIAAAAVSTQSPLSLPLYLDLSPLLARKDGRVYIDFKENKVFEYCYEWARERWFITKDASLVTVEVQMCLQSQGGDRMTIMIANTFHTIYSTLHAQGLGPPCIMLSPGWWRKAAGAEAVRVGNQSQYEANKAKSIEVFCKLYGLPLFEEIKKKYVLRGDAHDIPEAVLMGYAAAISPDYIKQRLDLTSSHHGYLGVKPGTPVKEEERKRGVKPITACEESDVSGVELLRGLSEYMSQVNQKKDVRKYKSLEKKIAKMDSGVVKRFLGGEEKEEKKVKKKVKKS